MTNKIRQLEEDHELEVTEMKRISEVKLKELTDQQSKQVIALDASEKETKLLKEDVKALKVVCNFSNSIYNLSDIFTVTTLSSRPTKTVSVHLKTKLGLLKQYQVIKHSICMIIYKHHGILKPKLQH